MGRKAKVRQERKFPVIRLAGEQAEVFDNQMDVDREWFESSAETFYFRPEIDGEFNEYALVGSEVPTARAVFCPHGGIPQELPLGWVCVTDIGRALNGGNGDATGWRFRVRTSAPANPQVRQVLLDHVKDYLCDFLSRAATQKASGAVDAGARSHTFFGDAEQEDQG